MIVLIVGATGSIGVQALQILKKNEIGGIVFNKNITLAKKLIKKYGIKKYYSPSYSEFSTHKTFQKILDDIKPDIVLNAVVGFDGLEYTIQTINKKYDLALANKESLVIAGKFIKELAKNKKVNIYPVDSEHSSLYDLIYNNKKQVKKLYITCSGGSAYNFTKQQLKKATIKQIVSHPNWDMGAKITIDSATLINKCFEIVEAYWLFNTKNIEAIYHPQSLVHAMVLFEDNSINAQISEPDMKMSINWALHKYKTSNSVISDYDFLKTTMFFDKIDKNKHLPIKWAYDIINDKNNCLGTIINTSNEIAIKRFLNKQIKFLQIIEYIERNIQKYKHTKIKNIDDIFKLKNIIINNSNNE